MTHHDKCSLLIQEKISLLKLFAPTYWRGEDHHHNYATKPSRRGEQFCQILIILGIFFIALQQ